MNLRNVLFVIHYLVNILHIFLDVYAIINLNVEYTALIIGLVILLFYLFIYSLSLYSNNNFENFILAFHISFGIYGIVVILVNYIPVIKNDVFVIYFLYRSCYMLVSTIYVYLSYKIIENKKDYIQNV